LYEAALADRDSLAEVEFENDEERR